MQRPILILLLALGVVGTLPGHAHAALGGAKPFTSSSRPDLRSVSIEGTSVRWCFDKSLDSSTRLVAGAFLLGGYRSSTLSSRPTRLRYEDAPKGGLGQACVVGTFSSSPGEDLKAYTVGFVGEGAVRALGGTARNRADATGLAGSDSGSGARGFTAGPDLTGAVVDASTHSIAFVFDQAVRAVTSAGDFGFYTATGTRIDAVSASISGRVVRVEFPAGSDVSAAVRVSVLAGAALSLTDSSANSNPLASSATPGNTGATARPDLRSAVFSPSGDVVDFTYDVRSGLGAPEDGLDPAAFSAYLADGTVLTGSSATIVNPSTVRVQFGGSALAGEYLVWAASVEGAVRDVVTDFTSSAGGTPLGGNAGARAAGFTTGPDALAVSFDRATAVASVVFDQRVFVADPSGFRLLGADGSDLGAQGTLLSASGGPSSVIRIRFGASRLGAARALALRGAGVECQAADCPAPAVSTAVGGRDAGNVDQILAPVTGAGGR